MPYSLINRQTRNINNKSSNKKLNDLYSRSNFNDESRHKTLNKETDSDDFHNKDIEYLYSYSNYLLKNLTPGEIYNYTALKIQEQFTNAIVIVSEFDNKNNICILRSATASKKEFEIIKKTIKREIRGMVLRYDPSVLKLMQKGKVEIISEGIHKLSFYQIPLNLSRLLENKLKIKKTFFIPISIDHKIVGSVAMFSKTGQALKDNKLIETMINQTALAIKRSQVEEALDISLSRTTSLVKSNIIGIFLSDKNQVIEANDSFLKMVGYTRDDLLESKLLLNKITPKKYLSRDNKAINEMVTRGSFTPYEKELLKSDNNRLSVLVGGTKLQENPLQWVSLILDLTNIKEAEKMIKKLARIVEYSNDAIFTRKIDGTVTSWNKGAEKLLGYTRKEIIGKNINLVIPKSRRNEIRKVIEKIIKSEDVEPFETIRKRKDGKLIDVSISISPNINSEGKITDISIIARDVSDKKQFERRKDEFLNIASHELKTPLTSLKAYSQIIERKLQKSKDQTNLTLITRIESQINKLSSIVNDLLDVTKIESGQLILNKEIFDLNELIQEIVTDLHNTEIISAEKIYKFIIKGKSVNICYGDKFRIGQVLMNLLTNSIKYSPESNKIVIYVDSNIKEARVSIQDFGVGIPKDQQSHLFERFHQIMSSENPNGNFSSLGLGLYISYEIINRHGGKIWCDSEVGKGTTFTFTLPYIKAKNIHE